MATYLVHIQAAGSPTALSKRRLSYHDACFEARAFLALASKEKPMVAVRIVIKQERE
jgi:hypothetical protein